MLLMEWDGGGNHGHVAGDDAGHPTSVVCASGSGSYESGAEYSVEEVLFCPGTQKTVRDSCGEDKFPQLMALLAKRKVPNGRYILSDAERAIVQKYTGGKLTDWTPIHEESAKTRRRVLMRHINGAMAWVVLNAKDAVISRTIVVGLGAQELDVEYSYVFTDEEKKSLEKALVNGRDGLKAMRHLFGKNLDGLVLLSEKTDAYSNWTRRVWRFMNRGLIQLTVMGDGSVESCYPMEKGNAYITIHGLARY